MRSSRDNSEVWQRPTARQRSGRTNASPGPQNGTIGIRGTHEPYAEADTHSEGRGVDGHRKSSEKIANASNPTE